MLRRRILIGELPAGSTLPGERELSESLAVSRLTLRSALAHLEAEGLVHAVHGSGTRVLDYRESGGLDLFGHLASLVLGGAPIPGGLTLFASLMELRRAVAVDAVGLATERASAAELRAMRTHVDAMARALGDAHAFMVADLAFARMLVRATGNLAFELLFNSVVRTLEGNHGIELAFFANAKATLAVYGRLLDRMESRDVERARGTAARLIHRLDRTTVDALSLFLAASVPSTGASDAKRAGEGVTKKRAAKARGTKTATTREGRAGRRGR